MIDSRRALGLWRRLDVTVRDLPLGLLFLVASLLPSLQGHGTEFGGLPTRPADALAGVAAVLQCVPIAVRRRWPLVCLALVSAGFALDQIRGYHLFAGTMLPIALLSAGMHLERPRRATVIGGTVAFAALSAEMYRRGPGEAVVEFVAFYLTLALVWGIGAWMRSARAAEADRRRRVAEDARNAERSRIARELHDVVTHHVTAMVVQSEAAPRTTAPPSPGRRPSAGCSRSSSRRAGPGSPWSSPRRAPRPPRPAVPTSWPTAWCRRR